MINQLTNQAQPSTSDLVSALLDPQNQNNSTSNANSNSRSTNSSQNTNAAASNAAAVSLANQLFTNNLISQLGGNIQSGDVNELNSVLQAQQNEINLNNQLLRETATQFGQANGMSARDIQNLQRMIPGGVGGSVGNINAGLSSRSVSRNGLSLAAVSHI